MSAARCLGAGGLVLVLGAGTMACAAAGPETVATPAGATVPAPGGDQAPSCWIRGDPADLEIRISPLDSATVALGGDTVKVCYSQPRKLGRPIMGRLVPFGEAWRLGANEATALFVPFPATVAGVDVEPGWYSLYAVPGPDEWRIVVNGDARRWGIPVDRDVRARDLGSGTFPVESIAGPVEMLTIRLVPIAGSAAEMRIEWDRTRVSVPIRRR